MFKIGDIIVYGAQGLCQITCIETKQIGKTSANYYVLKPLYAENTAVFVPVENKTLTARMQSVMSMSQAQELIDTADEIQVLNIADDIKRHNEYKQVLSSNDRRRLAAVIKTLRKERALRRENNKKLNINDEQFLSKSEQLLFNELAFIKGISPEEAAKLIKL